MDVSGLFTNIPQKEGLESTSVALEERIYKSVPTEFIVRMLEIVLQNNVFIFREKYYSQEIGTAMGIKPAPPYTDNFMARQIDPKINKLQTNTVKMDSLQYNS